MKNGIQTFPENLTELVWTNSGQDAIASGSPVQTRRAWGVAHGNIAAGATGLLLCAGAFTFAKAAGTAVVQGQPLWWDEDNSRVSFTATGTPPLGTAREAADETATSVVVDLNVMPPPCTGSITIDATQAAASSSNGQVIIDTGWGVAPGSVQTSLRTVTTGRVKSAYDVLKMSGDDLGKVSVTGVGSGTQLDEGDVLDYAIHL